MIKNMSVKTKNQRKQEIEINAEGGNGTLYLDNLISEKDIHGKLETFIRATLEVGASVGFHEHIGESESYYILRGVGEYNDNGELCSVYEGDVTYIPSGHGHGIKNIGEIPLEFIALIIRE